MVYTYNQVAPVIFGPGSISQLGEQAKTLGCKTIMCVCDEGIKAAGISAKVESILTEAGLNCIVFSGVLSDPPSRVIDEAVALALEAKIDGVVGVGGGSSMDAAKAIALMIDRPGTIRDYLVEPPLRLDSSIPIVMVPTTSGTGSESTSVSVITYEEVNSKRVVYVKPSISIVDPELTKDLPPLITAYAGFDAYSHALESITIKKEKRNPRSELLALASIEKTVKYLRTACKDGSDMEARTEMALASNWAGIAFEDTRLHVGHAMTEVMAVDYRTPHGLNCAWVSPIVIEFVSSAAPEKVKLIGEAMGLDFGPDDVPATIGEKTANALRALMKECGIKSPAEMGIDRDAFIASSKDVMHIEMRNNSPIEVTEEIAAHLMTLVYDQFA